MNQAAAGAPLGEARLPSLLALHRAGRLDEAEAGYRACLNDGEAGAAIPLAALLLQRQRYAEAAQLLEPLAASFPDSADVATNLSVALRYEGRAEDALRQAQRACELAPERVAAWNALGLAAMELGRNEEALAAFESGLRLAPAHPVLHLHRGHCLRRLGRNEEALAVFASVARSDPTLQEAWRGLAGAQTVLGQVEQALHSYQRALQLAPGNGEIALELAAGLLRAGEVAEAVRRLAARVQEHAGDARAWTWLGRARLKQGDFAAARAAFEQAHRLDPDDPVIAHHHASFTGALPEAIESDYIRRLFDGFADHFDHTLVKRLGYATPGHMARLLRAHGADAADTVLDLGCGTGLMAEELARPGCVIDGVDLSPRMLDLARAKGLYRELHVAELGAFLCRASTQWQLIVAADVLIYIADLQPVFASVFERLAPGGWFTFSLECSASERTELPAATGRYRHVSADVCRSLEAVGFTDVLREAVVLRQETGEPVVGELVLARREAN